MRKTTPFLILGVLLAAVLSGCTAQSGTGDGDEPAPTPDTGASTATHGAAEPGTTPAATSASLSAPSPPQQYTSSGKRVTLNQAGSSTVFPIAEAWAEEFGRVIGASVVVGGGGSGAGIAKFCRGELDIADASRPIRSTEVKACEAKGIEPFEIQVAVDGLSVVVPKSNTFVDCLTVEQLNRVWTNVGSKQANTWKELDASWPDDEIALFGPGTDSGTYDYWKEVIIHPFDGTAATTRADYTASEDDNVLVQGVAGDANGLGFFGLAYYKENADVLNVVPVDGGDGCVEPTDQSVASGDYQPLARPLFMYTDGAPTGVLKSYFEQGLSEEGQAIAAEVGYIGLPEPTRLEMLAKVAGTA